MKFNLGYQPAPGGFKMEHAHRFMLVGSCFSEHIGRRLQDNFFNVLSNPGGNYYSPVAIANFLNHLYTTVSPNRSLFVQRDGRVASLEVQNLRGNTEEELLQVLTEFRRGCRLFMESTNVLVLTLGTAVAYKYKGMEWVTNNHKLPNSLFEKRRWAVDECVAVLDKAITPLLAAYPHLNILLTVSPVKYVSDGLEENNRSKATLLLTAEELSKKDRCHYFPAYELVTDDLRDYRFYEGDLIHPNALAVDYVWEKFIETWMSAATLNTLPLLTKYRKALAHRPLHAIPGSQSSHLIELTARINALLPHLVLPSLPEKP